MEAAKKQSQSKPIQAFAASARAKVTAQPAIMIITRAKIMYLTLTSVKNRLIKLKYTPKTTVGKAKTAATAIIEHSRPPAGCIKNAWRILP